MGIVYRARHRKLDRLVALKMILAGGHLQAEQRARFLREAQAAAAIPHPGIVQVYELGAWEGVPFLALEFCEAGSLAGRLNGGPIAPREAAGVVEQIARAIQAAHGRRILHRDLKPGNVRFAGGGRAKVTDFGLARKIEGASGLTQTGALIGTPSYMSPEQASGSKGVGIAADVWALGAILYECLTGRAPFHEPTTFATLQKVVAEEPVSPRQLNAQVPRDLEAICLKCLSKRPEQRYATSAELAEDLRRWQAGEPIAVHPGRGTRQGLAWAARNPKVMLLSAVAALVVVLGAIWATTLPRDRPPLPEREDVTSEREDAASKGKGATQPERVREATKAPGKIEGPSDGIKVKQTPTVDQRAISRPAGTSRGKKYALVVGVRDYESSKLDPLRYTENDAEDLAAVLEKQGGFVVRLLTTARGAKVKADAPTSANLRAEIKALLANKVRDDTVLIALVGHGIAFKFNNSEKEDSYFCPCDARLNDVSSLISFARLFGDLDDTGAGVKLLLSDASRNDRAVGRTVDSDSIPRLPRGMAVLFSCMRGERAFETPKLGTGHGIFFFHVIDGLKGKARNKRGEVTWSSLADHVIDKVSDDVPRLIGGGARQTPEQKLNLRGKSPILVNGPLPVEKE
jgi:hypothetical protein